MTSRLQPARKREKKKKLYSKIEIIYCTYCTSKLQIKYFTYKSVLQIKLQQINTQQQWSTFFLKLWVRTYFITLFIQIINECTYLAKLYTLGINGMLVAQNKFCVYDSRLDLLDSSLVGSLSKVIIWQVDRELREYYVPSSLYTYQHNIPTQISCYHKSFLQIQQQL